MLERAGIARYNPRYEQAPARQTRPDPLDALRGVIHAGDHADYRRGARHGDEAAH